MGARAGRVRANQVHIWHNPRCSKSRETLALLQARGFSPVIRDYLEVPPTRAELTEILEKLGLGARQLIRGKDVASLLGKSVAQMSESAALDAMLAEPRLIERPVVISGGRAALGRPPGAVLAILG